MKFKIIKIRFLIATLIICIASMNSIMVKSAKPIKPKKPTFVKAVASKANVKITWKKVNSVAKYEVYCAKRKKGKYIKIKTTSALYFTDCKKVMGKTYYYKVRAYRMNGKRKVYSEFSKIRKVTVMDEIIKIYINRLKYDDSDLKVGEEIRCSNVIVYFNSGIIQKSGGDRHVTNIVSSNPSIAEVTKEGYIKGIAPGECTITLTTKNGISDSVKVRVSEQPKPTKISIGPLDRQLSVGIALSVPLSIYLDDGRVLAYTDYYIAKYSSSNPLVAKVTKNYGGFMVEGIGSGECTITFTTINALTNSLSVKVVS